MSSVRSPAFRRNPTNLPPEGGTTNAAARWEELAAVYEPQAQAALTTAILPFWRRSIDEARGGVFNCWNNAGSRLVSRDKFTWSQGRFLWLWSRLAGLTAGGAIPGDAPSYLAHAKKTLEFLQAHAFLADERCAFLLSEDGAVKEAIAGQGPAPSIYADCFVMMGFAEYARASGDRAALDAAWQLFEQIERRIASGGAPTHPEPTPAEYEAHGIAMIFLNLTLVLCDAGESIGDERGAMAREKSVAAAQRIFDRFLLPGGRIAEMRSRSDDSDDTLLSRHINPGHSLEGAWMLLTVATRAGRADWVARAHEAVRFVLERGWDEQHDGLLHYVDRDGGPPTGVTGSSVYEAGVRATWDTKLWWVHSEAIYTTALSYRLSGDDDMRIWFERLWEHSFRVFPHPVPAIGEWIQIRDRTGAPLERVVALPVKDPYHIARNLIQVVELFSGTTPTARA